MNEYEKSVLKQSIQSGVVQVRFKKVNGDIRVMLCTINPDLIPKQPDAEQPFENDMLTLSEKKAPRKQSDESYRVYDVEKDGWRSFRWDSVIDYSTE